MAVNKFSVITAKEIIHGSSPEKRASMALDDYAERLRSMVSVLRPIQYAVALTWVSDWRMYCFEKNIQRWPDGKFYLLNRSYQYWRGHRIAFDRQELTALGCDDWDRCAIRCAHDATFVPMEGDCFHLAPNRRLRRYAELVTEIARAFEQRSVNDYTFDLPAANYDLIGKVTP